LTGAVFVGLFAVILATCFLVVAAAVRASARYEISEELRLARTLFVRQLESPSQQLVAATRLLSLSRLLEEAIYVVTTPYFAKTAADG
jgi:hypothetical protein